MSYTTSWEEQGLQRGLKMGLEQGQRLGLEQGQRMGREEGLRCGLQVALGRLFGDQAQSLLKGLATCDLERLERLQERLAAGADLGELERVAAE